jgi:hypothetical protein
MKNLFFLTLTILWTTSAFAQNCTGWGDGIDSIKVRRYYEEYRTMVAGHQYDDAVFFWKYVYKKAPGATKNVYLDGVKMYKHFYKKETDATKKTAHLNKIISIFDQRATCMPKDLPNILARKAIELYWLEVDVTQTYQAFLEAIQKGGNQMPSFAIVPCAEVVGKAFLEEKISADEKNEAQELLQLIAQYNMDKGIDNENYYGALVNAKLALRDATDQKLKSEQLAIENIQRPLTPCEQMTARYKSELNTKPKDDRLMTKTINALRNMECDAANSYMHTLLALQAAELRKQIDGSAVAIRSGNTLANANFAFKNGDYEKAVELYQVAILETGDAEKRATFHYQIAKILYAKLDKKADAKAELLSAIEEKKDYGAAYMLLGDLYLAGAKECFPTDQFTQKMVIYASINKWKMAKKVDSTVTEKANQRISKYKNYLPSSSELFLARSRFKGKTYRLGSWINEKVKVKKLK